MRGIIISLTVLLVVVIVSFQDVTTVFAPKSEVKDEIKEEVKVEARKAEWGVYTGWTDVAMKNFEILTGKKPDMEMVFIHWGNEKYFPLKLGTRIRDQDRTMVLFWEAIDYNKDMSNQEEYSQDSVLAGKHDDYFKKFAEDAKTYGGQVILIPYSEFNGNWYPWSGTVEGNSPEKYIASYRYMREFFRDAPNVKFAWVVNSNSVPNTPENQIELYYPGGEYVDYVGVDGFNSEGLSFSRIFDDALNRLKKYDKPIYIFSFATREGSQKAEWIRDALTIQIPKHSEIVGWLWFNEDKESDWRINSDPASLQAFISALP